MPVYDKEGHEVELASVLTPDEIIAITKLSPLYQETLSETIGRRKEIKELRGQITGRLEQEAKGEDAPATPEKSKQPETTGKPTDPEELVSLVLGKLSERDAATQARQALITTVMQANKLDTNNKAFRQIIGAGSDEQHMTDLAVALAQSGLKFDNVPGGNGQTDLDGEGLMSRVNERIFGKK